MVARGEIRLLICQIAFGGGDGLLPYDLFLIVVWALVLNTIVGPLSVAVVLHSGAPPSRLARKIKTNLRLFPDSLT